VYPAMFCFTLKSAPLCETFAERRADPAGVFVLCHAFVYYATRPQVPTASLMSPAAAALRVL